MRLVRSLASTLLLAAPAAAQGVTKDAPARSGEEHAVLAVVNRLFDAMRAGDSAAVRAVVHPNGTLFRLAERDGAPTLGTDSIGVFVRAVGRPHAEVLALVEALADDVLSRAPRAPRAGPAIAS